MIWRVCMAQVFCLKKVVFKMYCNTMKPEIQDYINQFWGKLWVLHYFQKNVPDLKDHIAPMYLIKWWEKISEEIFALFKKMMQSKESDMSKNVIARASLPGDWDGMVDYLPTSCPPFGCFDYKPDFIHETLYDSIINSLGESKLSEVTLWISPVIYHDLYTVTENPNEYNRFYIDIWWVWKPIWTFEYANKNVISQWWRNASVYCIEEIKNVLQLISKVRETNFFDNHERLQYEIGVSKKNIWLFQVRKFAEKFASYSPEINRALLDEKYLRFMWDENMLTTPLKYIHTEDMYEFNHLEKNMKNDFIFHPEYLWTWLNINPQTHYLKWFVTDSKNQLYHNLTAPSQLALKNKWFVVFHADCDFVENWDLVQWDISQEKGINFYKSLPSMKE